MAYTADRIAAQATSTGNLIWEKFRQSKEYATTAWDQALDLLDRLGATVLTPNIPNFQSISLDDLPNIAAPQMPTRPDALDMDSLHFVEVNVPVLGTLMAYPVPVDHTATIGVLRTSILAKIIQDVAHGSTGLDPLVEAAIWDRALSRLRTKHWAMYLEAESYFSSRGFDLPPGALAGRLLEIQAEILQEEQDINNDILVKQAELAQNNQQFVIKEGAAIAAQIELNQFQMISTHNKEVIDIYIAEIDAFKSKVAMEIARIENIIKTYLGLLEAYKTEASIASLEIEVQIKTIEARIKKAELETNIMLKEAEIAIETAKMLHAIQTDAVKAAAQIAAQLAASAMSSVNASASMGYSAGSSESSGFSESHGYDETKEVIPGESTSNVHSWDETK